MKLAILLLAITLGAQTPLTVVGTTYVTGTTTLFTAPASIPLSGLIAAWDFTRLVATPQTVSGAFGTSYTLTNGPTSGSEGNDCTVVNTTGIVCATSGSDDFMHAPVLDSDVTGAVTAIIIVNLDDLSSQSFVTKNTSATQQIPIKFWSAVSGGGLQLTRANTTANLWDGPVISSNNFRMYTVVAPSDIANPPDFFVGTTKTAGTLTSGSASGAATGNTTDLQIGLASDSSMAASYTVSYVLIYNRAISDSEVASIYTYMQTYMAVVGVTLP